jgi:hypothetical protein
MIQIHAWDAQAERDGGLLLRVDLVLDDGAFAFVEQWREEMCGKVSEFGVELCRRHERVGL